MLRAYCVEKGRLQKVDDGPVDIDVPHRSIWVDLIAPDAAERESVMRLYKQDIPESEEVEEIEASARYFKDEQGVHIPSLFLYNTEGRSRNVTVDCKVSKDRLF